MAQVAPGAPELREVDVLESDAGFVAAPAGSADGGTQAVRFFRAQELSVY